MGGLLLWAPWTRPLLGLSESVCRARQSCPTKGTGSWAISPPLPLSLSFAAAAPRGVNRSLMQQLSALRQLKVVAALGSLFYPKTEMLLLPERDFRQERQELKVESHGDLWGRQWGHGWDTNSLCYSVFSCIPPCPTGLQAHARDPGNKHMVNPTKYIYIYKILYVDILTSLGTPLPQ